MEKLSRALAGARRHPILTLILLASVYVLVANVWNYLTTPPLTPAQEALRKAYAEKAAADYRVRKQQADKEREQKKEMDRYLCQRASACKKYAAVRVECATAGNLKTCLNIKMGDDAKFIEPCSGFKPGGAAVPLPVGTPNAAECLVLTLF